MTEISVIIPTYYRNSSLPTAINSALSQTYTPTEILIVDDSGEQNAATVVKQWDDDRVHYLPLDENIGAMRARQRGLDHATGDFIQFLDDDDKLDTKKFSKQLEVFQEYDYGVVYSGLEYSTGKCIYPQTHVEGNVLTEAIAFDMYPCCFGTMLFDADLLNSLPDIPNGADDLRIQIECARRAEFGYVDEALIQLGGDNVERSLSDHIITPETLEEVVQDYEDLYTDYPESRRSIQAEIARRRARRTREDEFSEKFFSAKAVRDSFRAARLTRKSRKKETMIALATLGGRLGIQLGEFIMRIINSEDSR